MCYHFHSIHLRGVALTRKMDNQTEMDGQGAFYLPPPPPNLFTGVEQNTQTHFTLTIVPHIILHGGFQED